MATPTKSKTPLRILCFGDSLTHGYPSERPYAVKLQDKLEHAFRGHLFSRVEYDVDGVPGDMVTRGSYVSRMRAKLGKKGPYDWTIILGGTNDLAWSTSADDIITSLEQTWNIPLSKGSKVLALTILDTRTPPGRLTEQRDAVNKAIKEYKKPNFFSFDLYAALPYHDMAPKDRLKYWMMDGVHLTAAGYDLMGEKIAEELIRIMRLADAQDTEIDSIAADPRQRRAIEDLIFEEERGNPRLLSQGYIVVRKTDLD
ncbi:SGNH hydrolase [Hypoxylon sp. FL1284]|nr:SGNH hydrolase [Hypoxylon sp. FL1284]